MKRNNFGLMIALVAGAFTSPTVFEFKTSDDIARTRNSGYLATNYRYHAGGGSGLGKPSRLAAKQIN